MTHIPWQLRAIDIPQEKLDLLDNYIYDFDTDSMIFKFKDGTTIIIWLDINGVPKHKWIDA